jgi:hypothetical protein
MEQAEFLFSSDVNLYLREIKKKVLALYPKCFERDHLASAGRQDAALSSDISKVIGELVDSDFGNRKKIFAPYLELSHTEMLSGDVTLMKSNGWQRLWLLLVIVWALPILAFAYSDWPTNANVTKGDIYMKMNPADGNRLIDYFDVVSTQLGGTNVLNPKVVELQQDKDFLAASPKDQKAYLAHIDPDFAKASSVDQDHYLANITGQTGPSVDVDRNTLRFVPGVLAEDQDKTIGAYRASLRKILTLKKASFAWEVFAFWIVPAVVLYMLGLGIAWVRRGFGERQPS